MSPTMKECKDSILHHHENHRETDVCETVLVDLSHL